MTFEFGVFISTVDGRNAFVAGRCFFGPIAVGAVFTKMRRYFPVPIAEHVPVELTVKKIVLYSHDVLELDEGLTAELHLEGVIPDGLDHGAVLVG